MGARRAWWEFAAKVVSEQAIAWLVGAALADLAWRHWGNGGGRVVILALAAVLGLSSGAALLGYARRDFRRWRAYRSEPHDQAASFGFRIDTLSFADAVSAFQARIDAALRARYDKDEAALHAIIRSKPRLLPFRVWRAILRRVLYLEERRT